MDILQWNWWSMQRNYFFTWRKSFEAGQNFYNVKDSWIIAKHNTFPTSWEKKTKKKNTGDRDYIENRIFFKKIHSKSATVKFGYEKNSLVLTSNIPLNIRGNFVQKGCWGWLGELLVAYFPVGQGCQQQNKTSQQDPEATKIKRNVIGLGPVINPTWKGSKKKVSFIENSMNVKPIL